MNKADLHTHTTASDGLLTPKEVIKYAYLKNVKAVAITDHDTTIGIEEAIEYSEIYDVLVIPGIEFSCVLNEEEVHILGLFIDYKSEKFKVLSDKLMKSRFERAKSIVGRLNFIGIDITIEDVLNLCDNSVIGRPHIARVLMKKGYCNSISDAFDKYLGNGKPAFVSRYKLKIKEAVDVIHNTKGIAILAHPGLINQKYVEEILSNYSLDGVEVFHSKHTYEDIEKYTKIAHELNLIATGGSDWHGDFENDKCILGEYGIDFEKMKKMRIFKEFSNRR